MKVPDRRLGRTGVMLAIRDGEFTPKSLDVNYGCRNMYTYNMYLYILYYIILYYIILYYIILFYFILYLLYIYYIYIHIYIYVIYIYIYVSRQKGYPPVSSNVGKAMEKALAWESVSVGGAGEHRCGLCHLHRMWHGSFGFPHLSLHRHR